MDSQQEIPATALSAQALPARERSHELAELLSQIFHPLTLSMVNVVLVSFLVDAPWYIAIGWGLLAIVLQVTPSLLFFTIRLRQGAYSDKDVSVRQQRTELYLFSFATLGLNLVVFWLVGVPIPYIALVLGALVVSVVSFVINLFWKISVHASCVASTAVLGLLLSPVLGLLLWVCAFAVGWARVRTRNHTPLQVVAGYVVATIGVWGTMAAFGLV